MFFYLYEMETGAEASRISPVLVKCSAKLILIVYTLKAEAYKNMKIAVYGNQCLDNRIDAVCRLFGVLSEGGVFVEVESGFFNYLKDRIPDFRADRVVDDGRISADVVVSVGGDGTFLRTAAWVGVREIPILGVNMGHLGYLSDVDVDGLRGMVAGLDGGDFRTESRSLIEVRAGADSECRFALNEAVVLKNDSSSMLSMDTVVDGAALNTYLGDGLIVATPTGSTAYNLSVGGPILHPACRSFVISPVAAHSLTMRPLVLPDDAVIAVTARSDRAQTFRMAVDGESLSLPIGTTVSLRRAAHCVKVVLRDKHNFACTLRNKLMWGADSR